MPNTMLPHRHQAAKAELQPDREQQQDDAELGERLDAFRVGDRDPFEPGIAAGQRAQAERPGDDPDQDEADDRVDLEAGEGRDDDPGRAEDGQRVAQCRMSCGFRPPCPR